MSAESDAESPILPAHIEDTVQAIARLHADHYQRATRLQRFIDRLTAAVGRPGFVAFLTGCVVLWVGGNLVQIWLGLEPVDQPPFNWLQAVLSLLGLYLGTLILVTQRHADRLAEYREQLTLELAILSEQKSAKVIQLLEELRRDLPSVHNRVDLEAEAMATPADPQSVLDAIKEKHGELGPDAPRVDPDGQAMRG